MKRREFLSSSLALLAGSSVFGQRQAFGQVTEAVPVGAVPAKGGAKPNVVVILADDLGYADLGCQGCKDIPTPNIDSIARNGVRFTDGYANHPVCSPSRAGLMSGRYQHRFGFEHNSGPESHAADNFGLPRDERTLAERLKELGYATGMVGKWHIGFKEGLRPHERGFDYHFGFLGGAHNYLPGGRRASLVRNGEAIEEREYLTDAFARESVAFVERSKDKPFFLYLAFNAVHAPLEATKPYEDRFPHIADRKRRTYAAMSAAMDDAVGRVLAKLREHELEDNTLIFFYSDNGGPTPQTTSRNAPLRGYKGMLLEGGIRVPFLMQFKGTVPTGQVCPHMVMGFDVHATALAAAGGAMPTDKPLDGVDLLPFLTGKREGAPHQELFWRAGEQQAVRSGDWKLLQFQGQAPQLYNLREDIGESRNLAADSEQRVQELRKLYQDWSNNMTPAQWRRQGGRGDGRQGGRMFERFKQYDKDGDGRVTQQEFPQSETFKQIDANGDGVITLDELPAYLQRRRQQRGL